MKIYLEMESKQHIAPETASRTLLSICPLFVSEDILKPLS
jgi:hypothetical protein